MNSKRSEIFKIVNNKILNIVTGTFYEMNFDISDPYNNFITYNSTNDETLFVSNTVRKKANYIKIYRFIQTGFVNIFRGTCYPNLVLTNIEKYSYENKRLVARFYDYNLHIHSYKLIDDNSMLLNIVFDYHDIRLKNLTFFDKFLEDPYNTNNQYCMIDSTSEFIIFRLE
jgi:hypothetical protein